MSTEYPYNSFSRWLLKRYGCRVRKVALAAPFGCPNRDGTVGLEGCYFCDEEMGGFENKDFVQLKVEKQLNKQIENMEIRTKIPLKYLAYLQAGSNTYGNIKQLKSVYKQSISHNKVVSVAIGTRPDCINEDVLDLIETVYEGKDVWIELGVQTSNEESLKAINRNHTFADTTRAIELIQKKGFFICAHLIVGIPGETEKQMIESVRIMNSFGIHGIKFHPLSICRGAKYARDYPNLPFDLLEEDQYIRIVIKLLEQIKPDVVIQRLVGGGRPEVHLDPDWALKSAPVIQKIRRRMKNKGSIQGLHFKDN